uniref:Methyltransferase type 11 domain-containing protein n=1 Tax=Panagrolaimus davidi TaxID=227884 RepID=A0A914PNU5_9BILA
MPTEKLSYNSKAYSLFRPNAPPKVIDVILKYLEENVPKDQWNIVVDVGCGNGQGLKQLSKHFKQCYGFDISEGQIKEAQNENVLDNVVYDVCPAETLPAIKDKSVQLLTAFTAAHYFDRPKFFKETDRVLVDNGVVAFVGYYIPVPNDPISKDEALPDLMSSIANNPELVKHENPLMAPIKTHYCDLKFPDNYEYCHKDNIDVTFPAHAQDLIGYIQTWSFFQAFLEDNKTAAETLLKNFERDLKKVLKTDDLNSYEITLTFNYFIGMGRKKSD